MVSVPNYKWMIVFKLCLQEPNKFWAALCGFTERYEGKRRQKKATEKACPSYSNEISSISESIMFEQTSAIEVKIQKLLPRLNGKWKNRENT